MVWPERLFWVRTLVRLAEYFHIGDEAKTRADSKSQRYRRSPLPAEDLAKLSAEHCRAAEGRTCRLRPNDGAPATLDKLEAVICASAITVRSCDVFEGKGCLYLLIPTLALSRSSLLRPSRYRNSCSSELLSLRRVSTVEGASLAVHYWR